MDTITFDDIALAGFIAITEHSKILVITAPHGMLGCGYLNLATAERTGDALAIVTGVGSYTDMLAARVSAASTAALSRGVRIGQNGADALRLLL